MGSLRGRVFDFRVCWLRVESKLVNGVNGRLGVGGRLLAIFLVRF